ncbi:condensation domain-containing protein [Streptomyces sp. NPDC058525]|uniref:condensation domain-containing protein n=1 Tax=Streptomyces sp. NPDC058525 TaxID=3346538 RepID=UPI00365380A1
MELPEQFSGDGIKDHPVPASFNQESRIASHPSMRGSGSLSPRWYAIAVEFPHALDEVVLQAALKEFVIRHEGLLSGFRVSRGLHRFVVDGTHVSVERNHVGVFECRESMLSALKAVFDAHTDPLAWPAYTFGVALDDECATLFMAFDHSVTDLHSLALAAGEIRELYGAGLASKERSLPAAGSFLDFCVEERQVPQDRIGSAVSRWRDFAEAAGGHLPRFPLDLGLSPEEGDVPLLAEETDLCSADAADRFEARCRSVGGGTFAGLLAALGVASGAAGVRPQMLRLMAPYQTRNPAMKSTFGWFVNAVPLEFRIDGELSFDELVRRAHTAVKAAFHHVDVPFGLIERQMPPHLVEQAGSWVSYLDYRPYEKSGRHAATNAQILTNPRRGQELDLWMSRTMKGVAVHARYPDNRVARDNVREYLRRFSACIDEVAADVRL